MAVSLKVIRKRIASIKNTQQITKAMKMVAAAKLKRAQDRAVSSRHYLSSMSAKLALLNGTSNPERFPLLNAREEEKRVLILLCTSNRGLCGSFNSNLIRKAEELARTATASGKEVFFSHVGKRGYDYFRKRGYSINKFYQDFRDNPSKEQTDLLAMDLKDGFLNGDFDRVTIVGSRFNSAASNTPVVVDLLPIQIQEGSEDRMIIFEPEPGEIKAFVIEEIVKNRVRNAVLETGASEQGARMTAMEAATTNAGEILRDIVLEYNKARQAAITKELIEIVGGAEAQRG